MFFDINSTHTTLFNTYILCTDAGASEQQELMIQKIRQCCVTFDFYDNFAQIKSKEVKRAALNELIDHITSAKGAIQEPIYPEVIKMVTTVCPKHDANMVCAGLGEHIPYTAAVGQ